MPGGISKLPFEVASHKKFKNPRWTYFYFFARRSRLLRRLFAMIPLKFVRPFPRKYSRSFFLPVVVECRRRRRAKNLHHPPVPSILPRYMWQTSCNGRGLNSRCLNLFQAQHSIINCRVQTGRWVCVRLMNSNLGPFPLLLATRPRSTSTWMGPLSPSFSPSRGRVGKGPSRIK